MRCDVARERGSGVVYGSTDYDSVLLLLHQFRPDFESFFSRGRGFRGVRGVVMCVPGPRGV